jgi:hypothetical protein
MTVPLKSAPIKSLGISLGGHHLKVVVADDTVSFGLAVPISGEGPDIRKDTGFVAAWGGSSRKVEIPEVEWLTRINEKDLRRIKEAPSTNRGELNSASATPPDGLNQLIQFHYVVPLPQR